MATVAIETKSGGFCGAVEVENGSLEKLGIERGEGSTDEHRFTVGSAGPCRLSVSIGDAGVAEGGNATRVTLGLPKESVTFMLRDVSAAYPIYLPQYGLAVTTPEDPRCYDEISEAIRIRGGRSHLQSIENDPEESFEAAADSVIEPKCQTWLGLSRDMRVFEIDVDRETGYWGWIHPRFHANCVEIPELEPVGAPPYLSNSGLLHRFVLGRGSSCVTDTWRRLEDGVLPILHGGARDGDIDYRLRAFAAPEQTMLSAESLRGSHFLAPGPGR